VPSAEGCAREKVEEDSFDLGGDVVVGLRCTVSEKGSPRIENECEISPLSLAHLIFCPRRRGRGGK